MVDSAVQRYFDIRFGEHEGKFPELQWQCPFCLSRMGDESSKRKLRVNVQKGRCICFRCGYSAHQLWRVFWDLNKGFLTPEEFDLFRRGTVPEFTATVNVREAVIATLYAGTAESGEDLRPVPLPLEYVPLWGAQVPQTCRRGLNYMVRTRGIDPLLLETFRVGYCSTGDYAQRVIFPVLQFGRQVYHTNRFAGDENPAKSKNPPNEEGCYSASACLLNYDNVVGREYVVLVEGPISCMASPVAVAMLGKRIHPPQIRLLEILVQNGMREVVVGVDADASAQAIHAQLLGRVPKVTVLSLDWGDPHDRRRELNELLQRRAPLDIRSIVRQKLAKAG